MKDEKSPSQHFWEDIELNKIKINNQSQVNFILEKVLEYKGNQTLLEVEKIIDLDELIRYCESTRAMVGKSILDDFCVVLKRKKEEIKNLKDNSQSVNYFESKDAEIKVGNQTHNQVTGTHNLKEVGKK